MITPDQFRGELQACLQLLNAGQAAVARPRIDALIAARPEQPDPYALLGLALDQLGDAEAGAASLRRAIAINPRQPQYRFQLERMLTALADRLTAEDRADEAVAITVGLTAPEALQARARALKALWRFDEAVAIARRLLAASPGNAGARHNLAAALADAGDAEAAETEARAALAAGLDAPETWLVLGRALEGQARADDAEAAYRQAIRRRPDYAEAHADLSQMLWARTGDAAAATAALDAAPGPGAAIQKAKVLEFAGHADQALAEITKALAAHGEHPVLLAAAAHMADAITPGRGLDFARRAAVLAPGDRAVATALCEAELAAGESQAAARTAEALSAARPNDQLALALQATAWRLLGDARYADLYDYALVRTYRLPTPAGWPGLPAFLAELATALAPLHGAAAHPVGQSLRQGSQTMRDLMRHPAPAVRAFFEVVRAPIAEHVAWLGQRSDPVRRRNRGAFRFAGVWSVRLRPGGFHNDHVHPRGWLSSAFYVDLPPAVAEGRQGWLKFGEPGPTTRPSLEAEHYVRPEPGLLALFPSYMWHGTVPFGGDAPRLTIAFDLVPA